MHTHQRVLLTPLGYELIGVDLTRVVAVVEFNDGCEAELCLTWQGGHALSMIELDHFRWQARRRTTPWPRRDYVNACIAGDLPAVLRDEIRDFRNQHPREAP